MRRPHTDQNREDALADGFAVKAPRPFPEGIEGEERDTEGHAHIRYRTDPAIEPETQEPADKPA